MAGGAVGGGLTGLALNWTYGATALAAAALGVYYPIALYPIALVGGASLGAYLGKYLSS